MGLKKARIFYIALMLALAGSFFGFIDDRFRGWSDTHQYQVEAKAWSRGSRPPVKELLLDPRNPAFAGPTHVSPLIPYLWSYLVDPRGPNQTLHRISIFQACLLAWSFVAFVLIVGQGAVTFDALSIAVILFFHGLVRWWVYMPMSEPQSLAVLLTSYLFARFSGLGAALQAVTRPPVVLLQLPQLFRHRKSPWVIAGFVLSAAVSAVFFGQLIRPSAFQGIGWGLHKSVDTITQFRDESAWIFKRLLPYQQGWFLALWGTGLIGLLLLAVRKAGVKRAWVWLVLAAYLAEVLLGSGEGFRYFFPAVIFLLIELKPKWPKSYWVRIPVLVLVIHLCVQQVEAIRELRRDRTPESDSPGLMAARQWIQGRYAHDAVIMMFRYRFCVNYFDAPCVPLPSPGQSLESQIHGKNVSLIVINRLYWQFEELAFEKELDTYLKSIGYPLEVKTRLFENVRIVELDRSLLPQPSKK